MKKRMTKILAGAMALCLLVGTFAYFTDRVESNGSATAGTIGITEADTWADNLKDADGARVLDNLNPGDSRSLAFSVTNTGNKAVDIRHTLKLSVLDSKGQPKAMSMRTDVATKSSDTATDADVEMLQFEIFKASDVVKTSEENNNKGYQLKVGAEPLFSSATMDDTTMMGAKRVVDADKGTVTYYFADSILDGVGANAEIGYAKALHVDGTTLAATDAVVDATEGSATKNAKVDYDYVLIFRDTTLNDFQACTIHLDLEVEAKQHLNTNSSWEHVETISTTLNTSGVAAQDTTINVAPDNNVGVLNDVNDDTAGTYNSHDAH